MTQTTLCNCRLGQGTRQVKLILMWKIGNYPSLMNTKFFVLSLFKCAFRSSPVCLLSQADDKCFENIREFFFLPSINPAAYSSLLLNMLNVCNVNFHFIISPREIWFACMDKHIGHRHMLTTMTNKC